MRRVAALLLPVFLLPLLLLAGCNGSSGSHDALTQPKPSAFKDGPCRAVADPVLTIGRDARKLGTGASPPSDVRADLKTAQDAVAAVRPGLEPALAARFSRLVVAVGLVRLRSDANTYAPSLGTSLSEAYDAVVSACTA